MEIERKWLLKALPKQSPSNHYFTELIYLSVEPEVRLRRCFSDGKDDFDRFPYCLSVKNNGTIARKKIWTEVSEDFYKQALDFTGLEPIKKHYFEYLLGEHEIDIAEVLNDEKFIYAEVEFGSEEEAMAYEFPWPELVIKEVTNDQNYKMKNYWKKVRL